MVRAATKTSASQGSLFNRQPAARAKRPRKTSPTRLNPLPGKKIWLSATGLETRRRCPRCFWLQYNLRIYQPEGIVSRLANRFDGVIKHYFDLYRRSGELPPLVAGQVEGRLENPFQEKYFATVNDRYGYVGKLDECLVRADGRFTPVDHKTSSSDPTKKDLLPAYQFQLDSYAWLLEQNRKPTSGIGHLVYFYPDVGPHLHQGFPMQVTVKTLRTDQSRVRPMIDAATAILDGPLPAAAPECQFCKYVEQVKKF